MLKELIYPFDPNYILENKRKIKKQLLEDSNSFVEKKIAILGGSTTSAIRQMMELFLLNNGIKPSFYESEYNKFYEDAMFDNEELRSFAPDIIYVCTTNRNITKYPDMNSDVDALLNNEYEKYNGIWKSLKEKYNCLYCVYPPHSTPLFYILCACVCVYCEPNIYSSPYSGFIFLPIFQRHCHNSIH